MTKVAIHFDIPTVALPIALSKAVHAIKNKEDFKYTTHAVVTKEERDFIYSLGEDYLMETHTTKGELAEYKYPGETYDVAIPQHYLTDMWERGFDDAASHFVFLYPKDKNRIPYLAPITETGVYYLSVMAMHPAPN